MAKLEVLLCLIVIYSLFLLYILWICCCSPIALYWLKDAPNETAGQSYMAQFYTKIHNQHLTILPFIIIFLLFILIHTKMVSTVRYMTFIFLRLIKGVCCRQKGNQHTVSGSYYGGKFFAYQSL